MTVRDCEFYGEGKSKKQAASNCASCALKDLSGIIKELGAIRKKENERKMRLREEGRRKHGNRTHGLGYK